MQLHQLNLYTIHHTILFERELKVHLCLFLHLLPEYESIVMFVMIVLCEDHSLTYQPSHCIYPSLRVKQGHLSQRVKNRMKIK
jgi:hypothetical protein